ncbi:type II toxin-antitoxin system VapC family toxin [Paracidovorax citrulli]
MTLLLDTHLALWVASGSPRLSSGARVLVSDPLQEIFVSVVSLWEISIKAATGKLPVNDACHRAQEAGFL